LFDHGSWGGEFHEKLQPGIAHGDVIATVRFLVSNVSIQSLKLTCDHSGFANANLDLLLRNHSITHIILAGLVANTCLESTGRYGVELGYHVTMLKDATAGFSEVAYKAAAEVNYPGFAHVVKNAEEWVKEVTGGIFFLDS
jgi:nicotinamidase-related amidase